MVEVTKCGWISVLYVCVLPVGYVYRLLGVFVYVVWVFRAICEH